MTRLNLVLLLAVLASALYLVRTQYESRRLFVALERARAEAHRLDVEHDGLQVQQRAQATPLRVEKLSKEKLQMRTATPAITQYVTYKDSASALPKAPGKATSAGAVNVDRPPLGAKAPFGGSAAREAANVGTLSADRPPLGARAPSGGSAAREAANVGAISR